MVSIGWSKGHPIFVDDDFPFCFTAHVKRIRTREITSNKFAPADEGRGFSKA